MPETSTTEPAKEAPSHKASARALISAERIARRVQEMGEQISAVYADIDSPLVLVVILKGATVFAADLLRSLSIPAELEFVSAASYGSGTSPGGSRTVEAIVRSSQYWPPVLPTRMPAPLLAIINSFPSGSRA